jgi:uncharacterized protein (DUF2235 family)
MGRKIILLSDGTGNSSAKVWRTNVWRVFESLNLTGSDQVAAYDDGVGTSSFKPYAVLGGAFGLGLKRNVIDLYKFACRNNRSDDDEIFGFGFSRGAFTTRVVVWLIMEQGLIRAKSEAELDRKAIAAYRDFRRRNFHTVWRFPEAIARWLRDRVVGTKYSKDDNFHGAKIRFLGLWDTVAAYGMPVDELTVGISQWLFPLMLPSYNLDKRVARACHALSIDDERTTFHPTLWNESDEEPLKPRADGKRYLVDERISQVWFIGVHANVGGGYPDDSLAQIPLIWIMSEAANAGLQFKLRPEASPQTLDHPQTAEDKDGRIYDPRGGLGGYYRYGPRDINALGKGLLSRKGGAVMPRIHESVLARIKNNAHLYAPKGLPAEYEIVTTAGEVLPAVQNPYEKSDQTVFRARIQEKIWNTIWLRRIVYFLTVGATAYLAIFPLMRALPRTTEYESPLRWVSDIVRIVGAFLPGVADTWINGYARDPLQFLVMVFVIGLLTWWGSRLAGRIENNMGIYWFLSLNSLQSATKAPNDWIYRFRTHRWYRAFHAGFKKYFAPAIFAAMFAYLGLAFASHALFNIQDYAGWVCRDTGKADGLRLGEKKTLAAFEPSNLCQDMKVSVEKNAKYLLTIKGTNTFRDDKIDGSKGIYFLDPPGIFSKLLIATAIPLRRELQRPWFRIVARFGSQGGEETFLDPDPDSEDGSIKEVIQATRDGELYLFVNDAALGIPGLYGVFYDNNHGTAEVTITRQKSCFVCPTEK